MSIPENEEHVLLFEYDQARDGGGTGQVTLKPKFTPLEKNAIVKEVYAYAEKGLSSTGSPTVTFGHGQDVDGYLQDVYSALSSDGGNARSGQVAGELLWDDTNDHEKDFVIDADNKTDLVMDIGTAPLDGGKLSVYAKAIKPGTI